MSDEVTDFQRDVPDRSGQAPMPVDSRATWCAPCKVLSPILEQLLADAQGRWMLVMVNVKTHPALTRQSRVRDVPAVNLVIDGQVVDGFSGVMPPRAPVRWLDKRPPTPVPHPMAETRLHLARGRGTQARKRLGADHPNPRDWRRRLHRAPH